MGLISIRTCLQTPEAFLTPCIGWSAADIQKERRHFWYFPEIMFTKILITFYRNNVSGGDGERHCRRD